MDGKHLKEMSDLALVSTSITQLEFPRETPSGIASGKALEETLEEAFKRMDRALSRLKVLEERLNARMVPIKDPASTTSARS